jgi:uncharacterized protein (DUF2384 family)
VAVRGGAIDPKRLAEMLLATTSEVAELANVHRSSLTRNPDSPEIQRKLGPIATILSRAADMSGSLDKAVVWFRHQPIAALGHARAADLVRQGEADAVLDYLDALENGAYA